MSIERGVPIYGPMLNVRLFDVHDAPLGSNWRPYNTEALEPVTRALPAQVDHKPAREMARVLRAPRRRQFVPRPRALAQREARGSRVGM